MNKNQLYSVFKWAFLDWLEDNAILRAAALTFFIIIPLPTLLLIIVEVFTVFIGETQAVQIVVEQIASLAGPAVADLFRQLLASSESPLSSVWTALVVIGFSVGGAIGTFAVLRDTMNCIWEVKLSKGEPLWKRGREKVVPFLLVTALGLVVIVWTALTRTLFDAIRAYSFNAALTFIGLEVAQVLSSFAVALLLLAIIYKVIPEAKVHWQDVALATIVTSIAFTVANYIFGLYVQTFVVTTVEGAAGALLVILLWIFVLNLILLYGAEVSKVYAVKVRAHSTADLPGGIVAQAAKEDVIIYDESAKLATEIVGKKSHKAISAPASTDAKSEATGKEFLLKIKKPKKNKLSKS